MLTVGELAERWDVSVRTFHYWEERGVLCPSERTWPGHRLYSTADLRRAQLVLVYRSMGMPLSQVKEILREGHSPFDHDDSEGMKEASLSLDARQISGLVRNLEQQRRGPEKDQRQCSPQIGVCRSVVGAMSFSRAGFGG